MIVLNNFFIISPRGDTVIAKSYRTSDDVGAHERSHTEAFFRKIKFWDGIATPGIADSTGLTPTSVSPGGGDSASGNGGGSGGAADGTSGGSGGNNGGESTERKGDAPPVFIMPDGLSYIHVKRNGLIFGCSTNRNVSPCTVVEVRTCSLIHTRQRHMMQDVGHD
jgi:AP-4 complex subunit mu-1